MGIRISFLWKTSADYVIFRKKWLNSLKDSRAYTSFWSVGSDHKIVYSTVKLCLCASKKAKPRPMKTVDWKEVSNNSEMSKKFTLYVFHYKFQSLSVSEISTENIEKIENNGKEEQSSEQAIPFTNYHWS